MAINGGLELGKSSMNEGFPIALFHCRWSNSWNLVTGRVSKIWDGKH